MTRAPMTFGDWLGRHWPSACCPLFLCPLPRVHQRSNSGSGGVGGSRTRRYSGRVENAPLRRWPSPLFSCRLRGECSRGKRRRRDGRRRRSSRRGSRRRRRAARRTPWPWGQPSSMGPSYSLLSAYTANFANLRKQRLERVSVTRSIQNSLKCTVLRNLNSQKCKVAVTSSTK